MKRSFKLITLFNIPIEISYTWFIVLGLVVFTLARGYFPATNPELPSFTHWLMALVAALLLFASLLAHELSHSLVAVKNDLPIHGITLFIFGGVAHLEKEPPTPAIEFKMAVAGPIMSFSLAIVFFALNRVLNDSITYYLFIINLVVGLFNLIPGFPLDGGRVLRAALWHSMKDLQKATGIASAFGKGFALFLMATGLLNFLTGSLISGIWLILIGLFLQEAAETGYRQTVMKKVMSGISVKDIMTRNVVTVPADIALDKLLDEYFFRFRFASFPVMEDDRVLGLITFHAIKEIEREKWPSLKAKDAMLPLNPQMTVSKGTDVITTLSIMAGSGSGRLLVIDNEKLIGIVSQRDILSLFELKAEING